MTARFKLILEMDDGTMRDYLIVCLPDYHSDRMMHFQTQDGRNVNVNLCCIKVVTAMPIDLLPGGV